MDVDDLCLQFGIEKRGEGRREDEMNFFINWIKRQNRKRKIKELLKTIHKEKPVSCEPFILNSSLRIMLINSLYDLLDNDKNIIFIGYDISGILLASEMSLFRNTSFVRCDIENSTVTYPSEISLQNKKFIIVTDIVDSELKLKKCIRLINFPIFRIVCIYNSTDVRFTEEIEILSVLDRRDCKLG